MQTEDSNSEFIQNDSFPKDEFWTTFVAIHNKQQEFLTKFLKGQLSGTRILIFGNISPLILKTIQQLLPAPECDTPFALPLTTCEVTLVNGVLLYLLPEHSSKDISTIQSIAFDKLIDAHANSKNPIYGLFPKVPMYSIAFMEITR